MNHIVAARLHAIDATPAPWRGGVGLSPWSPRPRLAEKGLCEDIGRHWLIRAQVFLTDSDDEIRRKIMTHAFSGGRETAKLQRELGADLDIDVAYQWLRFFLEDDEELDADFFRFCGGRCQRLCFLCHRQRKCIIGIFFGRRRLFRSSLCRS